MPFRVKTSEAIAALMRWLEADTGRAVYRFDGPVTEAVESCAVLLLNGVGDETAAYLDVIVVGRDYDEVRERDSAAQARHRGLRLNVSCVRVRPALQAGLNQAQADFERLDDDLDRVEEALAVDHPEHPALLTATGAGLITLIGEASFGLPFDDYFSRTATYELRRTKTPRP